MSGSAGAEKPRALFGATVSQGYAATVVSSRLVRSPMQVLIRPRDWSVRVKLAAMVVVITTIPVVALAYLDIQDNRRRAFAEETRLLGARADQLVGDLDQFNQAQARAVGRLATIPEVVAFLAAADAERLAPPLATRLALHAGGDPTIRVGILDRSGRIRVATDGAIVGQDERHRRYVDEVLAGRATISDPFLWEDGAPSLAYAAPVRGADHEVLGLAVFWIRAEALWNVAHAANELAGAGSFAVIFDHDGVRIAHTYDQDIVFRPAGALAADVVERLVAERRFGDRTAALLADVRPFRAQFERARAPAVDGRPFHGRSPVNRLVHYGVGRRFATTSWTVFYMVPEQTLTAPIERLTRRRIVFTGVAALAAVLAGLLFATVFLRPLATLERAAERLARGDAATRVPVGRGDELGRLAASFNSMATRLESRDAELRRHRDELAVLVQEGIAELAATNVILVSAEAEARAREHQLATTLDSIGDAVIVADAGGGVSRMNPVAERLTGWSLADARGRPLREVFRIVDEETRAAVESPVARMLRDGLDVDVANRTVLIARDGAEHPIADSAAPIVEAGCAIQGVVLVFRDMTEERAALRALRANEQKYRDLYERSSDMHLTAAMPSERIADCNQTLCDRLGYTKAELIGQPFHVVYHPEYLVLAAHSRAVVHGGGEFRDVERLLRCKDGSTIEASLSLRPSHGPSGERLAVAVWRDVGARKQSERDLRFLTDLADALRLPTAVDDLFFDVASRLAHHLGCSRSTFVTVDHAADRAIIHRDFHGQLASMAGDHPLSSFSQATAEESRQGRTVVIADTARDPRTAAVFESSFGPLGLVAVVSVPLRRGATWVAVLSVSNDQPRAWLDREIALIQMVAERTWAWAAHLQAAEAAHQGELRKAAVLEGRVAQRTSELSTSLREREVLLQEVHHRVKNNLQVISSLINMQVRRMEPGPTREALDECKNRVFAIGLVHEKLYQSNDYSNVQFAEYARGLAASIFDASGVDHHGVSLALAIDDTPLAVDRAIPCGLVINELISNALKHGFRDRRGGTIRVELNQVEAGRLRLTVADDGAGLPDGFDAHRATSMGLRLVCTLARQLKAELVVRGQGGASFQLTFAREPDAA